MGFHIPDYRFATLYDAAGVLLAFLILALLVRPGLKGYFASSFCLALYVVAGAAVAAVFDRNAVARILIFNPLFSPVPVHPCERMFVYYQGMNYRPLLFSLCCAALLLLRSRLFWKENLDVRPEPRNARDWVADGMIFMLGAAVYSAIVLQRFRQGVEGVGFYTADSSLSQLFCFSVILQVFLRQFRTSRPLPLTYWCFFLAALSAHVLFAVAWREQQSCLQQPSPTFPLPASGEDLVNRAFVCGTLFRTGLVGVGVLLVMMFGVVALGRQPRVGGRLERILEGTFVCAFASGFHVLSYWLFYAMNDYLRTAVVLPVLWLAGLSVMTVLLPLAASRFCARPAVHRWVVILVAVVVLVVPLLALLYRGSVLAMTSDMCHLVPVAMVSAVSMLIIGVRRKRGSNVSYSLADSGHVRMSGIRGSGGGAAPDSRAGETAGSSKPPYH